MFFFQGRIIIIGENKKSQQQTNQEEVITLRSWNQYPKAHPLQ